MSIIELIYTNPETTVGITFALVIIIAIVCGTIYAITDRCITRMEKLDEQIQIKEEHIRKKKA